MPTIMLSPHFSLQEFLISETASREGIKNVPDQEGYYSLKRTAFTMELVRAILGDNPVSITSGYRCPELNAATGGSSNSAHMYGLAADFICPGFGDPRDICNALVEFMHLLRIDQLILEYEDWVHLAIAAEDTPPREEILTINNAGTCSGIV